MNCPDPCAYLAWSNGSGAVADERELERVRSDSHRVIEAIGNGFAVPDLKVEGDAPQKRKTARQARVE